MGNRASALASYHRRAEKFVRAGKTTRGKVRQRRASISPLELAWRDLRAGMGEIKVTEPSIGYWQKHEV